jgi:uncharacterized protein with ATP-grasp and redox domains
MKRTIAITTVAVLAVTPLAMAQSVGQNRPIADVARDEEARRNSVKKPAKVYTNGNLRTDISAGVAPPPSAPSAGTPSGNTTPSNTTPGAPSAAAAPAAQDQAAWQSRIKTARDQVTRTQMFADSLQTRINSLTTDFVNRDDPAQKAKIEADRKAALAELERVRKELEEQNKAVKAIEEEARRAGVPVGWLRPGA